MRGDGATASDGRPDGYARLVGEPAAAVLREVTAGMWLPDDQ